MYRHPAQTVPIMIPKIEPIDPVPVPVPGRPSARVALGKFVSVAINVEVTPVLKAQTVDVRKMVSAVVSSADLLWVR